MVAVFHASSTKIEIIAGLTVVTSALDGIFLAIVADEFKMDLSWWFDCLIFNDGVFLRVAEGIF